MGLHGYFKGLRLLGTLVALAALAVACAGADPTPTPTAKPAPAATATPTAKPAPAATAVPTPTPEPSIKIRDGATPWVLTEDVFKDAVHGGTLRVAGTLAPGYGYDPAMATSSGDTILALASGRLDRLVRFYEPEPSRGLQGHLAKSWEFSNAGKTLTLTLQKDVKWHDGTAFTAEDVAYSLNRMWKPPEGVFSSRQGWFVPVEAITAVDSSTVRMDFSSPFPLMIWQLAYGQMGMNQKAHLQANDNDYSGLASYPGTGPFVYASNSGNEVWKYVRNDNYWNGDLPFLDAYEYYWLDRDTAGAALVAGRIDHIALINANSRKITDDYNAGAKSTDPKVLYNTYPGYWDFFMHMNLSKPPFDDVRVRQAINMVFHRYEAVNGVQAVRAGFDWKVTSSWVPNGSAWESLLDIDYDQAGFHKSGPTAAEITLAKSLMADAGYPDGLGTLKMVVRPNLKPGSIIHAQTMEASLKKVWPTTKFEFDVYGSAEAKSKVRNQDFDASWIAFLLGAIDHPGSWLVPWYRSGGGDNYSNYNNPEFDKIADRILTAETNEEIVTASKEAIAMLDKDMPAISAGMWPASHDAWKSYFRGHFCSAAAHEHNQCNHWDTSFLVK